MKSCVVGVSGVTHDDIIEEDVRSTYNEIVDNSFNFSSPYILVLGYEAAKFYQNQNGDKRYVADIIEPSKRDKLISSAVDAWIFSSYSDSKGWLIEIDSTYYNLCSKVKQSCGLSGPSDEISIIEFLNYLGLVNPDDTDNIDNYRQIRNIVFLEIQSLPCYIDSDNFRQLNNFLRSEIPIEFLPDEINRLTEIFIDVYKDRISEEGLNKEILDEISVFEKRFGEFDTAQKMNCAKIQLYICWE
ncbi:hypothetical protein GQ472_04250 [archaeon]|nr:hypothetical protein [archaeon]